MIKVCTEHLQPGMEMARDIPGVDESVFLAKGTILTTEDIAGLLDLGVEFVNVSSMGKEQDKVDLARRCEEYVRPFFYYVNSESRIFNVLYRESLESTMQRLLLENAWYLPCPREMLAVAHQSRRDLFFHGEGGPEDIVGHEMELISVPETYFKLQEILKSPKSSASHVAKVVRLDVNLVAKLLRLVNSPMYSFPTKVDSVERAVAIIGVEGVSSLALGITAMPMFKDIPPDLMDVATFWKHSISCAIFSKELAHAVGLDGEKYFTAGLLHDVGRLLLLKNLPEAYLQVLLYARGSLAPLIDAEKTVLGYSHDQVGEVLLRKWDCPENLVSLAGGHHFPADSQSPRDASIILLADNLAHAFAISGGWTFVLPGMEENDWQSIGIDTSSVTGIFCRHGKSLKEISNTLL